jgi:hypothetical protein
MRRDKAAKRGRWFVIALAGLIGFILGDWHAVSYRPTGLSPSQNVALRFPEAVKADAEWTAAAVETRQAAASATVLGEAQLALLNPEPMVAPAHPPATESTSQPAQAAVPAEPTPAPALSAAKLVPASQPIASASAAEHRAAPKSVADAASRHASRPGYMFNDAQIASIKARLHLTPDQERLWPAVEAALRNVAYARAREVHRQGATASAAFASADPDSVEVQGLKSAAIPLLMSFSDEQKNEVRSLAHVMGLDNLAAEF